jgi:hypothetical protein
MLITEKNRCLQRFFHGARQMTGKKKPAHWLAFDEIGEIISR